MNININQKNQMEFSKQAKDLISDFKSGKLKRRSSIAIKIAGLGMSLGYVGTGQEPYSSITEMALDLEVPKKAYNHGGADYDKDWVKFTEIISKLK